jgi:hypothetical protein
VTTQIFLERTFDPPISADDVHERARLSRWCFEMYRVDWCQSLLSTDGRRMVCWFVAPDAESARAALRQAEAQILRLWPGTVHDAPQAAQANVLVERSFDAPVELKAVQAIEDAGAWCLEAHHVKFVRTLFSSDHRRMLCLYAAPDAESVRFAQRQAGMPVDDIWAFTRIEPPGVHAPAPAA